MYNLFRKIIFGFFFSTKSIEITNKVVSMITSQLCRYTLRHTFFKLLNMKNVGTLD
jgi:hypothetical protein